MVDIGVRDALIQVIRRLSNKYPVAFLELIQPHQGSGAIKSTIVANAYEVFLEQNLPTAWPVDEIRALWLRSVDLIPDAIIRDAEPDGGFKEWIWSQTQRHWTARKEIGRAINPYMMWQSALVTGCAGEQIVSSNPLHATAIEITRIAEYADEVARTIQKGEDEARQCRTAAQECCQARDTASDRAQKSATGKANLALGKYRDAEMRRVRIRSLAEVVTCYEMALIPHLFSARPAKDLATLEGVAHFRQVAVALANYANSKATSDVDLASDRNREEAPQTGDSMESTFWRKRFERVVAKFETCEPIEMVMIRDPKPTSEKAFEKVLDLVCDGDPNAELCSTFGFGDVHFGSILFYIPSMLRMSNEDRKRTLTTVNETFEAAGIALRGIPDYLIEQCSPVGMKFQSPRLRWAACLFDAALQKRPGCTHIEFNYIGFPGPNCPKPSCKFATLKDVAATSIELIEWLMSWKPIKSEMLREETSVEPQLPVVPLASSNEAKVEKKRLRPCDLTAASQYKQAMEDNPELSEDRDAYNWYIEHLKEKGESMPAFATWAKYLRNVRLATGEQKNHRGVGHETRSVVRVERLDTQKRTKADHS